MNIQLPDLPSAPVPGPGRPWVVLIVDDDPIVQQVTRHVLTGLSFRGRDVELISALSSREAKTILRAAQDGDGIAVALIDVVMENDRAGLDLVTFIRDDVKDHRVRIILRTGRPDLAVERTVVERYEINDYRTKAELDPDRLFTVVVEALRCYDALCASEIARRDIAKTLTAIVGLFDPKSPRQFYANLLVNMAGLLELGPDALVCEAVEEGGGESRLLIRAASGLYARYVDHSAGQVGDPQLTALLSAARGRDDIIANGRQIAFRIQGRRGHTLVACVESENAADSIAGAVLDIFRTKAASAFDNMLLVQELSTVQLAVVHALATVTGYKDHDSGGHLDRIERLCTEIAAELKVAGAFPGEIDDEFVALIGPAGMLHDTGMFIVPDDILASSDELVEEDFQVIARHPLLGHKILSDAAKPLQGRNVLRMAADIARFHHERSDGSGYPAGVRGDAIPVEARIVAVADVFDALISERVHRKAVPVAEALETIGDQAGRAFDPQVVDALRAVIHRLQDVEPGWFPEPATVRRPGGRGLKGALRRWFGRVSS